MIQYLCFAFFVGKIRENLLNPQFLYEGHEVFRLLSQK